MDFSEEAANEKKGGHNGVLHGASLCCGDERQGWPKWAKDPLLGHFAAGLSSRKRLKLNKIKISYPRNTWRAARLARGLSSAMILLIPHGLSDRI